MSMDRQASSHICAFSGQFQGLATSWNNFSRSYTRSSSQPLLDVHPACSKINCSLLALPARMGVLGLTIPSPDAEHCFKVSSKTTAPIAAMIALQDLIPWLQVSTKAIKFSVQKAKCNKQLAEAEAIFNKLPTPQQRLLECTTCACGDPLHRPCYVLS